MITVAVMSGGCGQVSDMLGLSSKPGKTTGPVEKPDPAKAGTTAAADATGSKAAVSKAATPGGLSGSARKRTSAAAAVGGTTAPASLDATSPEAALVDANPSLESRIGAHSTTASAPFVNGMRPLGDERRVYSNADVDVVPARLIKAQTSGPVFRNMTSTVNTMELIISKQGRVEEVKLTTPAKKMTDMLLLSGAKTWKFVPATKDGQPVRYRTQFSWEDTP